ncbi:MAG: mannose-1-phosphate guanylyltransferase, partial [Leptolyngbyaceae cyanobacterium]
IRGSSGAGVQAFALPILPANPQGNGVIPSKYTGCLGEIRRRPRGQGVPTKGNPTALMEACQSNSNVVLGGSSDMGFIFPQLHPGFDAMFCIAKLIEMLTIQEHTLGQIWSELPRTAYRSQTLRCPWTIKGALMRYMVESTSQENLELVDGVKIIDRNHDGWILVLPDAGEPLVHIFASSEDRDWVETALQDYRTRVQGFIEQEQGIHYKVEEGVR